MNILTIFGKDNGQEIHLQSCLHRYTVTAGYYVSSAVELPISEIEETLICRLPVEKIASASGLLNFLFTDFFLRIQKRNQVDGILFDAGTEDKKLSRFEALKWYISHIGKDVIWETLSVEILRQRFMLNRQEHYVTKDYNAAADTVAVSYAAADTWAKKHCGKTAEELIVWVAHKMKGLPAGYALQLK